MPASRPTSGTSFTLQIPRNSLKIAGAAFAAGVLLFAAVWFSSRDKGFYKADPASQTPQQVAEVEPLPEPLAAAAGSSDMPGARPAPPPSEDVPQLVETPAPAPAPVDAAPIGDGTQGGAGIISSDRPTPIAGQSPAPEYPPGALRRGESGSVVLRVDVDVNGQPSAVTLIQRSGSRDLDRAATVAVRRWRFTPAMSNGQPIPGSIEVPFDFALPR